MSDLPALPDGLVMGPPPTVQGEATPPLPKGLVMGPPPSVPNVNTSQQVSAPLSTPRQTKQQYLDSLPWYQRLPAEFVGNQTLDNAAQAIAHNQVSGQALKTVAQPIQGLMGLADPRAGQVAQQQINSAYGDAQGVGGFVGQQIGNVVNLPYTISGAGRALSAAAAAGNERIDIQNRRDAGQNISGKEELLRAGGMGALDYGINTAINKFGGQLFGTLKPAAAQTAKQLLAKYAMQFGKDAITNEVIQHVGLAANNLVAGRPMTEGMGANSIASGLVQTVGQMGLHEAAQAANKGPTFLSEMRRVAQERPNAKEGQNPQNTPSQDVGAHTPVNRQESDTTEPHFVNDLNPPKETRISAADYQRRESNKSPDTDTVRQNEMLGQNLRGKMDYSYEGSGRPVPETPHVPNPTTEGRTSPDENASTHGQPRPGEGAKVQKPAPEAAENGVPQVRAADQGSHRHPAELATADDVAKHYAANNGGDEQGGQLISAMMSMKTKPGEKFVKAIVPSDKIDPMNLTEDSRDPNKIAKYQNMSPEERSKFPPVYVNKDMVSPDGGHRVTAAQNLGEPVTAYVPESLIGQHGIKAASPVSGTVSLNERSATPTNGAAGEAASEALPQEAKPVKAPGTFLSNMREKGRELATSESGEAKFAGTKKFLEKDVQPAVHRFANAAKTSWDAINRFIGSGLSYDAKDRVTADKMSEAIASHDRAMKQLETDLKPHRAIFEKMSDKQKSEWADQVEATGESTRPDLQAAADLNRQLNQENIEEGAKVGLNVKKWEGDWLGRMATFPDRAEGSATSRKTMAGSQNFLKGRSFDTFSEFKNFVEENGGKLKYDNPMDMLLAKQAEVRRSIMARKLMYREEDNGQLHWVPDQGGSKPEGMTKTLLDPLARQSRREIAPTRMVGQLARMNHFEALRFLNEHKDALQYVRTEGTATPTQSETGVENEVNAKLPEGYSFTGREKSGQYYANPNVADMFNSHVSPGLNKNVPVLHQLAGIVKGTTSLALNLSGVHYTVDAFRSSALALSRAIDNATHGEWDLAKENAKLINPVKAYKLGKAGREQYADNEAHPELEKQVAGAVEGGAKFKIASALDEHHFDEMKKAWAEGNTPGAAMRLVKGVQHALHGPLFEKYVPNLKAAADLMASATADRRGLEGEERTHYLARSHDLVGNMLGMVERDRQYQNKIMSDVNDLLLGAPKFIEGVARATGAAGRDTVQAIRDITSGKKPQLTPSMYHAVAQVVAQVTLSTATQLAYTAATTGKPQFPTSIQDLIKPRTGRKDDQGREQRINLPTPISIIYGMTKHPDASLTSRIANVWRVAGHQISGVDQNNVEIRHKGAGFLQNVKTQAESAASELSPYSVQGIRQNEKPGKPNTLDTKINEMLGLHVSYTPSSKAEQEARDILYEHGRTQPLTQEQDARRQERGQIADEMKQDKAKGLRDLNTDLREGKLKPSDRSSILRQRKEKPGLAGVIDKVDPRELMERVWPEMTDAEKKQFRLQVRGHIGRSTSLSAEDKRELWKQTDQ